jgi:hypothetical protein
VNGRPVLVGDGIKVAKAGRKMPAVKKLHQPSESNTKPEYIFGHSCQAVAVLGQALSSIFAIPPACRIHEGVVFSNRDQRTLLDKMILLVDSLGMTEPFNFVADAYYATGKIVRGLLAGGNHLVTRVKNNGVAYYPAPPPDKPRRGRPKKYGEKIQVADLLKNADRLREAVSPVYGEKDVTIRYAVSTSIAKPMSIVRPFVGRSALTIATFNSDLSPKGCCRCSRPECPGRSGDPTARGSEPSAPAWPLPNRSSPSPCEIPSPNFSRLPPKPQSS